MELNFETSTVRTFLECTHQIKRTQVSMEGVVPDVSDDIGRIYSVQPAVFLKSKDLTTRGASVTGELTVALLYINEMENSVFDLHFTQSFSLDFDMTEPDPDMLAQIRLFFGSAEARALNPRKVSVTVEIGGELSSYTEGESRYAVCVPENQTEKIYVKRELAQSSLINAVCEKTFVLNEQFPFSAGKSAPERIVSQKVDFRVADRQLIGSKVLLKGSVIVSVCYRSAECEYPMFTEFTAPFSQLIDIGQEAMDSCAVRIEPTSAYFNLIDTIGGEKALDAEIHAVAQIVSRFRQEIEYVSDAYAGGCPSTLAYETWPLQSVAAPERILLESDARIELPEDCADVLSVMTSLGACSAGQGKAEAALNFDVLYRSAGGSLASARRMINLSADCPAKDDSLRETRLLDSYFRPDGNLLAGRVSVELWFEQRTEKEVSCAVTMALDEDAPYDSTQYPTVTAVRVDHESVWDLAKRFHSSIDAIEALNAIDGPIRGKLLLVPKCM